MPSTRYERPNKPAECCYVTRGCGACAARQQRVTKRAAIGQNPRGSAMAQIREIQFVHWGSLRPDILPLADPGITMFVGPNGSGKTCCLDGIKVLLGVSELGGTRTPAAYVFDGGSSGRSAEQAWLRATFANPVRS